VTAPVVSPTALARQEFDFSSLVEENERRTAPRRRLTIGLSVFFGLLASGGVVLMIWSHVTSHSVGELTQGLILAGGGASLAGYMVWLQRGMTVAPRTMSIGPDGISFGGGTSRPTVLVRWNDPHFRILVYDARGLPPLFRDGSKRVIDFVLRTRGVPWTPISPEAFEVLTTEAESRGLQLIGDTSGGQTGKGLNTVTISATRHP